MSQPESDGTMGNGPSGATAHFASPPPYFGEALEDAERLLKHAAETGADVDERLRDAILTARAARSTELNEDIVAQLLEALTQLAARLAPVTAQSLRAGANKAEERSMVRFYWKWAFALAAVIIPFSVLSFVTSAISADLRTDIATANDLAVKLRSQLGPPTGEVETEVKAEIAAANAAATAMKTAKVRQERQKLCDDLSSASAANGQPAGAGAGTMAPAPAPASQTSSQSSAKAGGSGIETAKAQESPRVSDADLITELQLYASTIRAIDARARQLNRLVYPRAVDPNLQFRGCQALLHNVFELPLGVTDYSKAALRETYLYQDVRSFAQDLVDEVGFYYGAISTCLLPILYALLGTCAYLLRSFEDQMKNRTFIPSHANSARFLIAGIGGAVVGLFNISITQVASVSPLAIAFLVGYGVDVFFSFLEGLIQSFTKSRGGGTPPADTPRTGAGVAA